MLGYDFRESNHLIEEDSLMSPVFIPAPHNHLLTGLKGPTEIRDYQGNVLGYFTPAAPGQKGTPYTPPSTDEELQRIIDDPREYTTEEVLAELEKL
jgi:hypothetical protein